MQRAMAAEAEANRDARAKVILAEGEMKASRSLKEAADIINQSPAAMQIRYLQVSSQTFIHNDNRSRYNCICCCCCFFIECTGIVSHMAIAPRKTS
ncbi:hypothetical protein DPMN_145496 [Dreissena polymorpha]|uniref:Uncharacterized protein n=1 Tax=Dreissena polymorpha TaxID=45954 RepID=A0A9D4J1E1_DREPO|nr:hypothetical protein DPMN_145496 [Dreissena polymorpha]